MDGSNRWKWSSSWQRYCMTPTSSVAIKMCLWVALFWLFRFGPSWMQWMRMIVWVDLWSRSGKGNYWCNWMLVRHGWQEAAWAQGCTPWQVSLVMLSHGSIQLWVVYYLHHGWQAYSRSCYGGDCSLHPRGWNQRNWILPKRSHVWVWGTTNKYWACYWLKSLSHF